MKMGSPSKSPSWEGSGLSLALAPSVEFEQTAGLTEVALALGPPPQGKSFKGPSNHQPKQQLLNEYVAVLSHLACSALDV